MSRPGPPEAGDPGTQKPLGPVVPKAKPDDADDWRPIGRNRDGYLIEQNKRGELRATPPKSAMP